MLFSFLEIFTGNVVDPCLKSPHVPDEDEWVWVNVVDWEGTVAHG